MFDAPDELPNPEEEKRPGTRIDTGEATGSLAAFLPAR
jgi:hypothetical protein